MEKEETAEVAADVPLPVERVGRVEGAGEGEPVEEDVSVHMTTMTEEGVVSDAQLSTSALPPATTTTMAEPAATTTTPTT